MSAQVVNILNASVIITFWACPVAAKKQQTGTSSTLLVALMQFHVLTGRNRYQDKSKIKGRSKCRAESSCQNKLRRGSDTRPSDFRAAPRAQSSVVAVSDVPPIRAVFIMPCAHNFCQICEQKIRHQMTICLSNGSGGRINGTAMIGGALLHGGIMNGTLVHGRMKDEG